MIQSNDYKLLLRGIKFKAKIDAVNFLAPIAPILAKRKFDHAHGPRGFPVQDPTRVEIEALAKYPMVYVEIAIDAMPKPRLRAAFKHRPDLQIAFEARVFTMLAESIFPWAGHGISTRKSAARIVGPEYSLRADRRPRLYESLYIGHKNDPAYVAIYRKVFDNKKRLSLDQQCVRVELRLEASGCKHHGLHRVGDLLTFNHREGFAAYFHTIKPLATGSTIKRKGALPDGLRKWQRQYHQSLVAESYESAGAHSLHNLDGANTSRRAANGELNAKFRRALATIV